MPRMYCNHWGMLFNSSLAYLFQQSEIQFQKIYLLTVTVRDEQILERSETLTVN